MTEPTQQSPGHGDTEAESAPAKGVEPTDDLVTTRHTVALEDGELSYTATSGRIVLRQEVHTDDKFDGPQPKAEVFVTAYTADTENLSLIHI